jgi:hypothetical protein
MGGGGGSIIGGLDKEMFDWLVVYGGCLVLLERCFDLAGGAWASFIDSVRERFQWLFLNLSVEVFSLPSCEHILLRTYVFLIPHFNAGYRQYLSLQVITPKHSSQARAIQSKRSHC